MCVYVKVHVDTVTHKNGAANSKTLQPITREHNAKWKFKGHNMPSHKGSCRGGGGGGLGEVIQSYDTDFTTRTDINAYKRHCCIANTKTHYLAPSVHREGIPFRQKTKLHSQYK